MATVGQQLSAPEAGWKRYEQNVSQISYVGSKWTNTSSHGSGGSSKYTSKTGDYAEFIVYGTKFRIISTGLEYYTGTATVYIDNVAMGTYSTASTDSPVLVFEKTNLTLKDHHVKLVATDVDGIHLMMVDAFDIDDIGELKPYLPMIIGAPVNLIATAGTSQVTLSWDAVTDAPGYNVKRATIAGGPYTIIANNVATTSYVDTDVVNGTTYYYVVTAITADGESANSNEASATPTAPTAEEGEAVLRVTMIDSSEREYKVSKATANDFATWCNRTIGTGNSCYVFDKGIQDSKEYLFYEKIISFEVIPLT
ncbi:fibronectin type III domain-containing protein [Anaerospora sp.]|uniref:fibronectin type III domain-containing protein n=1 Tax=Anaerospora sp. TaxID=1960278 RepID=UPI00289F0920|nr:fibronectin type III domain-containing protein [Anaerospora sp.]